MRRKIVGKRGEGARSDRYRKRLAHFWQARRARGGNLEGSSGKLSAQPSSATVESRDIVQDRPPHSRHRFSPLTTTVGRHAGALGRLSVVKTRRRLAKHGARAPVRSSASASQRLSPPPPRRPPRALPFFLRHRCDHLPRCVISLASGPTDSPVSPVICF